MLISVFGMTVAALFLMNFNATTTYGTQSQDYENLIVGKTSLVRMYQNDTLQAVDVAQTTGFYFVSTDMSNEDDEPKTFDLITMILDNDNVAREILFGGFTVEPNQTMSVGTGFFLWIPQTAGGYTLKTFVWSSLENNPEPILLTPNVLPVTVSEKIVSLSAGQRDGGLFVKTINLEQQAVVVSHEICVPTGGEWEQLMNVGDFVPISTYARAFLEGFDNENHAVFRFEATGQGLCQIACHHADSVDVFLAHYKGR